MFINRNILEESYKIFYQLLNFSIPKYVPNYSIPQFLITQFLITQFLITQFLITQFLITQFLITQFLITQFLITQFLITQFLKATWVSMNYVPFAEAVIILVVDLYKKTANHRAVIKGNVLESIVKVS